jgi:hypothetical protein
MNASLAAFPTRLYGEWLPAFCGDSRQRLSVEGFVGASIKLSDFDARNLVRALDSDVGANSFDAEAFCSGVEQKSLSAAVPQLRCRSKTLRDWSLPVGA